MAMRARSTIRSLQVLGNSIRGLDFAHWRKVFHAIILPVLTLTLLPSGSQASTKKGYAKPSRLSRMTPSAESVAASAPPPSTLSTPSYPFPQSNSHSTSCATTTGIVSCAFPLTLCYAHFLHTILSFTHVTPSTSTPPSFPFTKKSPPSHPSLYLHTPPFLTGHTPTSLISPTNHMPPKSSTLLSSPLPHDSLYIILRPISIDLPFSLVSVVFSKERDIVNGGRCQGATKSEALFKGLLYGLSSIYSSFSDLRFSSVTIFLPSNFPVDILFKLSKHPFLPLLFLLSLFWLISSSQMGPAGSSSGDSTLVASRV